MSLFKANLDVFVIDESEPTVFFMNLMGSDICVDKSARGILFEKVPRVIPINLAS
jgi:hypothetical protein